MSPGGLEQIDQAYLKQLYDLTDGDASVQVSMYDIGDALQLDRDTSSQVAQTLIGLNLAEIKTLSGGIGISPAGIEAVEAVGGVSKSGAGKAHCLSNAKILSQPDQAAVEDVILFLKNEAGGLGLNFEGLTELLADLRTIDAQLTSSRPKTDIVRACLTSIEAAMTGLGHQAACQRLRALTGE